MLGYLLNTSFKCGLDTPYIDPSTVNEIAPLRINPQNPVIPQSVSPRLPTKPTRNNDVRTTNLPDGADFGDVQSSKATPVPSKSSKDEAAASSSLEQRVQLPGAANESANSNNKHVNILSEVNHTETISKLHVTTILSEDTRMQQQTHSNSTVSVTTTTTTTTTHTTINKLPNVPSIPTSNNAQITNTPPSSTTTQQQQPPSSTTPQSAATTERSSTSSDDNGALAHEQSEPAISGSHFPTLPHRPASASPRLDDSKSTPLNTSGMKKRKRGMETKENI